MVTIRSRKPWTIEHEHPHPRDHVLKFIKFLISLPLKQALLEMASDRAFSAARPSPSKVGGYFRLQAGAALFTLVLAGAACWFDVQRFQPFLGRQDWAEVGREHVGHLGVNPNDPAVISDWVEHVQEYAIDERLGILLKTATVVGRIVGKSICGAYAKWYFPGTASRGPFSCPRRRVAGAPQGAPGSSSPDAPRP